MTRIFAKLLKRLFPSVYKQCFKDGIKYAQDTVLDWFNGD